MTRTRRITAWLSVLGILGIVAAPRAGTMVPVPGSSKPRSARCSPRIVLAATVPTREKGKPACAVDSLESLRRGGNSGPAIVPGDPDASLLILAVRHDSSLAAMPPKSKLQPGEIAALAAWVKLGAPWPTAATAPVAPKTKPAASDGRWDEATRAFWAFQPLKTPPLPDVSDRSWPRTPIDRFILSKIEKSRLKPAIPADKRTLIRRATLDLLGLPPTSRGDRRVRARRVGRCLCSRG